MPHPDADRDGSVAVQLIDEDPRSRPDVSLLSVLEVASRVHERVAQVLGSVDLSHSGYQVLVYLRANADAARTEELAEVVRWADGPASKVLDDLAHDGLIRVGSDEGTGSPGQVKLTPLGSARAVEGRMRLDLVFLELAARFGAQERVELRRLLDKAVQ